MPLGFQDSAKAFKKPPYSPLFTNSSLRKSKANLYSPLSDSTKKEESHFDQNNSESPLRHHGSGYDKGLFEEKTSTPVSSNDYYNSSKSDRWSGLSALGYNPLQHSFGDSLSKSPDAPKSHQPNKPLVLHRNSIVRYLYSRGYKEEQENEVRNPFSEQFMQDSTEQLMVVEGIKFQTYKFDPNLRPAFKRKHRYLIVLDIDETLLHAELIETRGMRVQKFKETEYDCRVIFNTQDGELEVFGVKIRPHVETFLKRMSKLYDLALYTASSKEYADKMAALLDPREEYFSTVLYREHCVKDKTRSIKSLAYFGEDKDVFIIDNLMYSYALHLERGIPILSFYDNMRDVELLDLVEVLERINSYDNMFELLDNMLGIREFQAALKNRLLKQYSHHLTSPTSHKVNSVQTETQQSTEDFSPDVRSNL